MVTVGNSSDKQAETRSEPSKVSPAPTKEQPKLEAKTEPKVTETTKGEVVKETPVPAI